MLSFNKQSENLANLAKKLLNLEHNFKDDTWSYVHTLQNKLDGGLKSIYITLKFEV